MRLHNTTAALGLGGLLVYIALSGKAPAVVALLKVDGPDIAKAIAAGLILSYIAAALPGKMGDLAEAVLGLATVGVILVNAPAVSREINKLFGGK